MLGSGSGRNWWCVAYPPLCFTEDVSGEMSSEGSAALKSSMSRDSYDLITSKAEYRFFIVDLAEKILK